MRRAGNSTAGPAAGPRRRRGEDGDDALESVACVRTGFEGEGLAQEPLVQLLAGERYAVTANRALPLKTSHANVALEPLASLLSRVRTVSFHSFLSPRDRMKQKNCRLGLLGLAH